MPVKKVAAAALVCACSVFGFSPGAFAHARLVSSTPAAGVTAHGPSIAITLKFDSRVDGARSNLVLMMPGGKIKPLKIVSDGASELDSHSTLPPGKYIIRWQALSTDGHITRGEIPFVVR
jgi:methionine-rich copper-binding protein CopC